MWFRRKFVASVVLLAILAAMAATSAARAEGPKDVLQLIPDDAWGFVVLKSLGNLDDKAAQVKEVLGLQFPTPITPMILSALPIGDKVDTSMPLCAVVMDGKKYAAMGNFNDAMVMLVPAKDPKAILDVLAVKETDEDKPAADKKGGDEKADNKKEPRDKKPAEGKDAAEGKKPGDEKELAEGITKIQIQGQPAYAAVKGKYIIVGSNQECITKVVKTKKTMAEGLPEARAAAIEKSDVFIGVAMSTLVNAYKDMFMPFLQMATAATDPEGKNIKQLVKILGETSAVDLSLCFDKNGLTLLVLMTPQKDSDMAKVMSDQKNSDKSLLTMLPSEKYLFTMGTTGGYSEANEKFTGDNMISQMIKSANVQGLNDEALKTLDAELLKLAKASGPTAMCISFLSDGAEGMFGVTVVAELKDPKAYVDGLRKIYKTAWAVTEGDSKKDEGDKEEKGKDDAKKPPAKAPGKTTAKEDVAKLKENIVHAADAETIEGAKVDTLAIKLEGLADMFDIGEEQIALVQKILGKEIVFRFGAVDDKHFVLTFGGGKKRFEAVSKHLKSPGESLDKEAGIKEASGKLPTPRVSEIYIAADNIAQAAKSVATALGEGEDFPFDVPTVNAPVAISGAMMGPVQQINILIPMKLIKAAKEVADKMSAGGGNFDDDEEATDEDEDAPAKKPPAKPGDKKTDAKSEVKKDTKKEKAKEKDKEQDEEN